MDIWSIAQTVVGGGFVAGVVELGTWLRNRKADKVKALAEAAQASSNAEVSDIEAQKAKIDLGEMFVEKVGSMFQQMEALQKQGSGNQAKIMSMLKSLQEQLNRQDELLENLQIEVNNQKSFLDGPYTQWLAEKQKAKQTNRYGNA
ncbi:MAG: hypothetical protein SPM02_03060 [Bacteroidales bacterium]|nr:hypothetical protein [Bacteroidales bacterium]